MKTSTINKKPFIDMLTVEQGGYLWDKQWVEVGVPSVPLQGFGEGVEEGRGLKNSLGGKEDWTV